MVATWQDTARQVLKQLNIELFPEQEAVFYDDARIKFISGGEGSSKSWLGALYAVCRSLHDLTISGSEGFGQLYWLVGADFEDARAEFGSSELEDYLLGWQTQLANVDASASSYSAHKDKKCILQTLPTVVEDHIVPAQLFETVSAYDPLKIGRESPTGIVGCEVSRWEREIWDRCYGRLQRRAPDSWGWFSGSPETDAGFFSDIVSLGKGPNPLDIKSFVLPSWVNRVFYPLGRQDPAMLQLEASMSADRFKRRHSGIAGRPVDAVLPEFNNMVHVSGIDYQEGYPVYLFVDPGDLVYCVLFVQFVGEEVWVVDEVYLSKASHEQVVRESQLRHAWKGVTRTGHVIDVAGTQHHQGMPSAVEAWVRDTGLNFGYKKIAVNESVERLRSVLSVNPSTGRPRTRLAARCRGIITEMGGGRGPVEGVGLWRNKGGRPERANDHGCKALAYGLVWHFGTARPHGPAEPDEDDAGPEVYRYISRHLGGGTSWDISRKA